MIEILNNTFAPLFEPFFDYDTNNQLLDCVFDNSDYAKIGTTMLLVSIVFLTFFYKIWDPIKNPKLKLGGTILIIGLVSFTSTYFILGMNNCIKIAIGDSTGIGVDPFNFMLQLSLISVLYGIIISCILSIFPFRHISTNNSKNPF